MLSQTVFMPFENADGSLSKLSIYHDITADIYHA
jgi:hypothetical protein